jgi:cytochrome b561
LSAILMAILLVAMLSIGVSKVVKVGPYHWLLAVHRPLGILILILAAIRLVTRLLTRAPELPPSMSQSEVKVSEFLLCTLFIHW